MCFSSVFNGVKNSQKNVDFEPFFGVQKTSKKTAFSTFFDFNELMIQGDGIDAQK